MPRYDAPIRAVLFDKDGTLVDFRATWLPAYRGAAAELARAAGRCEGFADELLSRLGYARASDSFAASGPLLWATNAQIARAWAEQGELATVDAVAIALRHFGDLERYPPQPVGDLGALLDRLRARGLALGVATMDGEAPARRTLERLGVADRLAFVAGCDSGYGEKPGPGMAQAFCAAVGVPPASTLVVGDTDADLLMARAAGCALAVAVRTGGTPPSVLQRLADRIIDSVQSLEEVLDGHRG